MSRVEVLSDSDEDENVATPPTKAAAVGPSKSVGAPTAPVGPVGPPKPPPGMVLKRVGKNKGKPGTAPVAPVMRDTTVPAVPAATAEQRMTPAAAVAAMRGDPSKPPPVAESDSESDDDSDDLPPPLEPMPFVAAAKKAAEPAAFPKPAPPIKLASATTKQANAPAAAAASPPVAAAAPAPAAPAVIGPPKPVSKKSAAASKPAKEEETPTGRPSYVDRDLLEFPLFLDKLPTERSKNVDIAALQDLAAEETPEQRAENFKNSGNECLQHGAAKWWDDAIEYYTRAIQCGSRDYPKVSVYFSNRAAVQILKKNWGHCVHDCLEALKLDAGNVKAMYRASKAYYELRKLPEALKYLRMAMAKAKTPQLAELERDIARRMRKERLKEEKRAKEMEEVLEKDLELSTLLRERGYRISSDDVYDVQDRLDQYQCKFKSEKNQGKDGKQETDVSMPVMVVYPQARTSDFVQSWNETLFVRDMLEMLFNEGSQSGVAREWDRWQLYTVKELSNMCVYLKTNDVFDTYEKQEWVRVKLSATLQEALTADPKYVIPVIPVFYVFHNSWRDTFFGKEAQEMYGVPAHRPQ